MTFGAFMEMYDDWNGNVCVNDDNLLLIVKGNTSNIMNLVNNGFLKYLKDVQVVSFGFYDSELCVRLDYTDKLFSIEGKER